MRTLLALACVLFLPALACAQEAASSDVIVLSIGGDAPPEMAAQARDAVAAALEASGSNVTADADVALRIAPARLRACNAVLCAHGIGRELGVSMVAAVATWSDPPSITVSLIVGERRAYSASEEVGEGTLTDAAARAVSAAHAARRRAVLVEGSTASERAEEPEAEEETASQQPAQPAPRERGLEEYVLPTILGVAGLGLAAMSVYALLDERCELRAPISGECLRGDAPNIGLGVVLAVSGGLAIAGAILWLIVGGLPPSMGNIDVVLGPDGGGVAWRATF